MFIKRFLMNEEGASPGNGTAPAPAPAAEPQAQGAAPVVDANAIAQQVRDSIFAELRRNGALKEKSKGKEEPAPPAPAADLRRLDRAARTNAHAQRLNDAAYQRLERAFAEENPPDAGAWLQDYFDGMGVAQQAAPAVATTTTTQQRSASPVSDGGTPPARLPLEEQQIVGMPKEDLLHLIKMKGAPWVRSKIIEQTRNGIVKLEK